MSIDGNVGSRLRVRRTLAGISQTELGERVSITFQQVQNYEKGINRISAGHSYLFARTLSCSPADFFEGLAGGVEIATEQEARLVREFARLSDAARVAVFDPVEALNEIFQQLSPLTSFQYLQLQAHAADWMVRRQIMAGMCHVQPAAFQLRGATKR